MTAVGGVSTLRIVITGNEGYVGPVFAEYVAHQGYGWQLVGVDTSFFREQLIGPDPAKFFVNQVRADIRHFPTHILKACDGLVHLAAVSNDPLGMEFEGATHDINAAATIELATICRKVGVPRFVHASSSSLYGAGGEPPRTERDELRPLSAYARAKGAAEEGLQQLANSDFQVTCLRFATACGVSLRLRLDLVMNDFVASAVQTGRIEVLSDGTPWRPLIHTEDMARAIAWALQRRGAPHLAINIGSDAWTWQIGELAHEIANVLGNVGVTINKTAETDKRSYRVDFSLFKQLAPDHQPKKTFEKAVLELKDCVKALNFSGHTFREFSVHTA